MTRQNQPTRAAEAARLQAAAAKLRLTAHAAERWRERITDNPDAPPELRLLTDRDEILAYIRSYAEKARSGEAKWLRIGGDLWRIAQMVDIAIAWDPGDVPTVVTIHGLASDHPWRGDAAFSRWHRRQMTFDRQAICK